MTIEIRSETAADVAAIEALTIAAFSDAAHTDHTEQFIVARLREAGQLTLSRVAVEDGVLIGHVALSPVTVSDGTRGWLGLGPVSVLPRCQRRGVGSRLVRDALGRAQGQGAAGCVVLGEPAFYGRFGFRAGAGLILPAVPPMYFQALAFGASAARGTVAYAPAFAV